MKHLLLTTCLTLLCFASSQDLYKDAAKLESQGNYKEAMKIYKQLALEKNKAKPVQKQSENTLFKYEDTISQKENKEIKKIIDPIEDKETRHTIEQVLSKSFNIYPYKSNYFMPISYDTKERSDRDQMETKFQISLKKPLSYNLLGLNETINFAYTQVSWWQLYSESAPFRETNYMPELFAIFPYKNASNSSFKAYKLSVLHQSNGQDGSDSRSWNRIYLEGYFQVGNLFIIPKLWYRIPEDSNTDDNPDIEDYLGYGDLSFMYAYKEHTFTMLFRDNLKFDNDNKGYAEFDWAFPLFGSKDTYGYLQLSSGYGDSLIDYNQSINRISFGISLSR